jgi:hypothetical protein
MKVRYSRQATRDLASTHEYLAERSPKGAANVMAAIYASVEFIKQYPRGAERTNIVGIFGKVVSKYLTRPDRFTSYDRVGFTLELFGRGLAQKNRAVTTRFSSSDTM